MNEEIRVLLMGGGTGGHIYPLIAVAEKIQEVAVQKNTSARLRYFGSANEYQANLQQANIGISKISSSKIRRYFSVLNFFDFFKFIFGLVQSWWKIFWFMPDVAFSKGGPGTLPIIFFCWFYHIPIVIHESDSVPSITTRISAKFSKKLILSFESASQYVKSRIEMVVIGNPIRPELISLPEQTASKTQFQLEPNQPAILFIGGSQGAERINDFILDFVAKPILEKNIQILHQAGRNNYQEYLQEYQFLSKNWSTELTRRYILVPFFDTNIREALSAADLVVSRAGSGGIFEIANAGKPSILIPLPESAQNHQTRNAYEYSESGAAIVIQEENLLPAVFLNQVDKILNNPEVNQRMSLAAKNFSKPEAAEKIAQEILAFAI